MIKDILSLRGTTRFYFFNTVYQWEDALQEKLGLPIKRMNPVIKQYRQRLRKKECSLSNDPGEACSLAFVMNLESAALFSGYNVIPVFLDTFFNSVDKLAEITKGCSIYYVTNYRIYEELKSEYHSEGVRFFSMPCADSLLDRAKDILRDVEQNGDRIVDVIQYGRQDPLLHEWMMDYCRNNPETEYVYQKYDYRKPLYFSTKRGDIGNFRNKQRFEGLITSSKVALVSGRPDSVAGYDFITPRIYETVAYGCRLIGRYMPGRERNIIGVDSVCKCVDDHAGFSDILKNLLAEKTVDYQKYMIFLENNSVSKRVQEYMADLL